jgi:elongation of very long chain fatty acids protein 4
MGAVEVDHAAYFSAAFNSWVHVAMYLYYLLAATIAKDENCRRKYLFWGKYLTIIQMIQFVAFIAQAVYGLLQPASYVKHLPQVSFFCLEIIQYCGYSSLQTTDSHRSI